uniref:Putative DNA binding, helix-turn-helix domain containing protein n=1 Tax=viral metagenome TaxID=1070528 RepID=A0A6M3LJ53_9ZZZZ
MRPEDEIDLRVTVAENVRRIRLARGLSQRDVATSCGWSESGMMLSHVEAGRRLPASPALVRLAMALGVTPNDILGFAAPTPESQEER